MTVMDFVGVSTGQSSIMRVFPAWAKVLGLPDARLEGYDLPLDADPARYRDYVRGIRDDPARRGALITTHKIALFRAAAGMFDELDPFAELCGEISSISKRDGRLIGHAKDPVTAGLSLEEFLSPGHFARTGGDVLCLGAGGAGAAITWYLAHRADSPAEIICMDVAADRLAALRRLAGSADDAVRITTRLVSEQPAQADAVLARMPAGSLIVNATGLGKDRPGSPLGPDAVFPDGAVVWEINYRGELDFLHQAAAQRDRAGLTIVDGWRYFVHGWSQCVAEVFGVELTPALVDELSRVAAAAR